MRRRLANIFRRMATALDGQKLVPERLHRISVQATNSYIGTAERYICDLEKALGARAVAIRARHPGRFNTQPLIDAGAWN